jgi:hypothetical protein
MTTRALRNNNPLNLRPSGDSWKGLRQEQTDPGYLQFDTTFHGLRAGAMNLLTYYRVHRRRTVRSIIQSWAPPSDNNPTESYISTVCKALGVAADTCVNLENGTTLRLLMEAMIRVEAGSQPFPREEIEAAINAAYGSHRSPPVSDPANVRQVFPAPDTTETRPMPTAPPPGDQPRDEIVPPKPDKPEKSALADQPSAVPTRKVVAGGLAGAIAFVVMVGWNRLFPSAPIPAEFATEIAGVVILGVTLVTQYFTRNRKTDIPPDSPSGNSSSGDQEAKR